MLEGTGLSATFGTDEVRKIHEENVNKLAGMSQEEIMAEQSKLLQTLGKLALQRYIGQLINMRFWYYSKTCVKWPLSKRPTIGFQDQLSLDAGQKYCRMLKGSILQCFRPALSANQY